MKSIGVGFTRIASYDSALVMERVEELCTAVGFRPRSGERILLKPNLVACAKEHDLACTHPEFVAGVAKWFLDHGCHVAVGDSPASGSCKETMRVLGLLKVVQNLGLELASFNETVRVKLGCGKTVSICRDALECDHLINLPKVKSHALVRVTLAVKNYFGLIKGWRKAMAHQIHGGGDGISFIDILCDIPTVVPSGLSIYDGITAMHITGPMEGEPYPLHLMGCSTSPHGLDAAMLALLGIDPATSPIWQQLAKRGVWGNDLGHLHFPLLGPDELGVTDFIVPSHLNPVRFKVRHVARSVVKRLRLRLGC